MVKIFLFIIYFLSAVGAMNWGLVEFFKFNLVDFIGNFFEQSNLLIKKIIYCVIASCGFITLLALFWGF